MTPGVWREGMSEVTCPVCLEVLPCTLGGYMRPHDCDGDMQLCVERQELDRRCAEIQKREQADWDRMKRRQDVHWDDRYVDHRLFGP